MGDWFKETVTLTDEDRNLVTTLVRDLAGHAGVATMADNLRRKIEKLTDEYMTEPNHISGR